MGSIGALAGGQALVGICHQVVVSEKVPPEMNECIVQNSSYQSSHSLNHSSDGPVLWLLCNSTELSIPKFDESPQADPFFHSLCKPEAAHSRSSTDRVIKERTHETICLPAKQVTNPSDGDLYYGDDDKKTEVKKKTFVFTFRSMTLRTRLDIRWSLTLSVSQLRF